MMARKTLKLHSVLTGLLEVSLIQEGKIESTTFPLRDFCLGVFESVDVKAAESGIELRCLIPPQSTLHADRKIMESVVQNLVHNAVNYHHKEGPGRFVEVSLEESPGTATLKIRDNGPGIPENIREKVFEMFYRGHNDSEGSGLGLYIVQTGVEKLGGQVRLTSQMGEGTVFAVEIPQT
jgi:signal transduction histidine kinase